MVIDLEKQNYNNNRKKEKKKKKLPMDSNWYQTS